MIWKERAAGQKAKGRKSTENSVKQNSRETQNCGTLKRNSSCNTVGEWRSIRKIEEKQERVATGDSENGALEDSEQTDEVVCVQNVENSMNTVLIVINLLRKNEMFIHLDAILGTNLNAREILFAQS